MYTTRLGMSEQRGRVGNEPPQVALCRAGRILKPRATGKGEGWFWSLVLGRVVHVVVGCCGLRQPVKEFPSKHGCYAAAN